MASRRGGRAWIGTSGYDYPHWRETFYPRELARKRWLEYAVRHFNSIELNGTFYSLKSPDVFRRWVEGTPGRGFVFAVKGSRFITHNLKLRGCERALANFFASGILLLGRRTGPFLWQLPAGYGFDPARIEAFLDLLPGSSAEAEALARQHDARLKRGAAVEAAAPVPYRHALEVRHPSYFHPEFYDLLRRRQVAFVIAETAGKFGYAEEVTAPFVYVRLHGSQVLYGSQYTPRELDTWARRVDGWRHGSPARDVYVYFDNDHRAYAAHDALGLARRVRARAPQEDGQLAPA
ncbi:MAG TPA: DUF72 domain-containing protein [Vicinamibacteria bacterium]|nr:DUF72 domain-containing protein [Vicinamibacteria bacterium]